MILMRLVYRVTDQTIRPQYCVTDLHAVILIPGIEEVTKCDYCNHAWW